MELSRLRGIVAARSWRGDVRIAAGARVGRRVRIEVARGGALRVGRGCRLGSGSRLVVCGGVIELGRDAVVGELCTLIAHTEITIGERTLLDDGVSILDFGPAPTDSERPTRLQPLHSARVGLGDDVVVGLRAAIGPGVRVPAGARVEPGVILGGLAEPLLALAEVPKLDSSSASVEPGREGGVATDQVGPAQVGPDQVGPDEGRASETRADGVAE